MPVRGVGTSSEDRRLRLRSSVLGGESDSVGGSSSSIELTSSTRGMKVMDGGVVVGVVDTIAGAVED